MDASAGHPGGGGGGGGGGVPTTPALLAWGYPAGLAACRKGARALLVQSPISLKGELLPLLQDGHCLSHLRSDMSLKMDHPRISSLRPAA